MWRKCIRILETHHEYGSFKIKTNHSLKFTTKTVHLKKLTTRRHSLTFPFHQLEKLGQKIQFLRPFTSASVFTSNLFSVSYFSLRLNFKSVECKKWNEKILITLWCTKRRRLKTKRYFSLSRYFSISLEKKILVLSIIIYQRRYTAKEKTLCEEGAETLLGIKVI